jgi:hypothetical protein
MKPLQFALLVTAILVSSTPQTATSQAATKIAGNGENFPTVQSKSGGSYYVRSIPSEDFGTKGKTQVFAVKRTGDELLDEYPVYMRGDLYLGWSPILGKWGVVHLEPARVTSDIDINRGSVTRLAFYMGGKEIFSYSQDDLQKLGLERKVVHLNYNRNGSFMAHGIEQIPGTNNYVFVLERTVNNSSNTERILLDITTGKAFGR